MDKSTMVELLKQRRFDEVLSLAEAKVESDPVCVVAYEVGFDAAAGKVEWPLALDWASRGLKHAPSLHDQLKALVRRAAAYMYMDDLVAAEADLDDVVRIAGEERAKGNSEVAQEVLGLALNNLALIMGLRGDLESRVRLMKEALAAVEEDGDADLQAQIGVNIAWTYLLANRPVDAAPFLANLKVPDDDKRDIKSDINLATALYLQETGAHGESEILCRSCLAGSLADNVAADFWWVIALNRKAVGDLVGAANAQASALDYARRDPWSEQLQRIENVFAEAAD